MFSEFLQRLSHWERFDTWIAVIGALAAMACALPGTWLLLRRQSLLGDALSHAVLPGIVVSYLAVTWIEGHAKPVADSPMGMSASRQEIEPGRVAEGMSIVVRRQMTLFVGAALSGVLAALLSEFIQRWGRVERSAALGVVFTSMFALGLLLIRLFADQAHLDPNCVLYGNLETTVDNFLSGTTIPQAAVVNGLMLSTNVLLVVLFFKELRLSTFDPGLADAQGLHGNWVSLVLMTVTAATVVAAFESVGAILVIAMLIVPGATARLLTDRLETMVWLGLIIAAAGAVLGHVIALTIPAMICSRIGLPQVEDVGTAGMIAVTSGFLFLLAVLFSPRYGIAGFAVDRVWLQLRIASEDRLGDLYRREEQQRAGIEVSPKSPSKLSGWFDRLVRWHLIRSRLIRMDGMTEKLTEAGEQAARNLVRSHRLWESYMARHFDLPDDHLHATAAQVEHFLGPDLQARLAAELNQPEIDPHGKTIPKPVVK